VALSFGNTSIGTIVLALIVAFGQWYQSRKIREVHVIVNSQKTAMQDEIRALRSQLKLAEAAPAEEPT
jgi:Na+/H+-translocating membrane pyrophosphatase